MGPNFLSCPACTYAMNCPWHVVGVPSIPSPHASTGSVELQVHFLSTALHLSTLISPFFHTNIKFKCVLNLCCCFEIIPAAVLLCITQWTPGLRSKSVRFSTLYILKANIHWSPCDSVRLRLSSEGWLLFLLGFFPKKEKKHADWAKWSIIAGLHSHIYIL